jgi:hypothetical protein
MGRKKCGEATWQPCTAVTHRAHRAAFGSLLVLLFVKLHTRLVAQKEQGYTPDGAEYALGSAHASTRLLTTSHNRYHIESPAQSTMLQRPATFLLQPSTGRDLVTIQAACRLSNTPPRNNSLGPRTDEPLVSRSRCSYLCRCSSPSPGFDRLQQATTSLLLQVGMAVTTTQSTLRLFCMVCGCLYRCIVKTHRDDLCSSSLLVSRSDLSVASATGI